MSNLFNEDIPQIDPNKDYHSELVGEGKKYRDEKALALGKVHADATIAELKRKLEEAQSELNTTKRLEELLTMASQTRKEFDPPNHVNPDTNREGPVNDLTAEKIESLISQKLTGYEANRVANENVRAVKAALTEKYGSGYEDVLRKAAENAGESVEWIAEQAKRNPKLVVSLVEAHAPKKEVFNAPPATRLNPSLAPPSDVRNWSYYQKIKERDPKYYESEAVQIQMHKDADRLREGFFN